LHFGQIGDAAATNGSRGPPSTLFSTRNHLLATIEPPTDATQREEDVPRGEMDLDRARLSGDSDREGTFQ